MVIHFFQLHKVLLNNMKVASNISNLKTMFQSKLNVVVSSYIATFIMPKFLKSFFNEHPFIDVSLHVKNENIEKILIIIRMTSGLAEINLN